MNHWLELRQRLLIALSAIGVLVAILLFFAPDLYALVAAPLLAYLPENSSMIATHVITPLLTPLKLSLVAGFFLGMPILIYQLWAFIAPALYGHERKRLYPLLFISIGLFYAGLAFAYFVVFPIIFEFLVSHTPKGVVMMTDISAYLDFVLSLFFAFGMAFQTPVITWGLIHFGIVERETMVAQRGHVIIGAFVIGMLLTPPDVLSQTLLAIPLWLLFELGLFLSKFKGTVQ